MPKRRSRKAITTNLMVRLPPELHKRLIKRADDYDPPLSLNRTIIQILEGALNDFDLGGSAIKAYGLTPQQVDEVRALFRRWREAGE